MDSSTENSPLLIGGGSGSKTDTFGISVPADEKGFTPAYVPRPSGLMGGVLSDLRARMACYKSDWLFDAGLLAPAMYIFFASVIPALTFGEQFADETDNEFGGAQVLAATAICGLIQSIFGGQPMLIVGVAEPIVLIYVFMYEFAEEYHIPYQPWCAVTLFWVALGCMLLASVNTCKFIHSFTRFSGELFGFLIAILFLQQGIKGLTEEYHHNKFLDHLRNDSNGTDHGDLYYDVDASGISLTAWSAQNGSNHTGNRTPAAAGIVADEYQWRLFNGTWAVFIALGFIITTMVLREAQTWTFFNESFRRLVAEYATFIMVVVWTAISYGPRDLPEYIPRRLLIDSVSSDSSIQSWTTISRLDELESWHIGAAAGPAVIIIILFYFDHNVSSQLAQSPEFNLQKPEAYHWDFFLLGVMTLVCGLLGLPPVNGVLPQAPMHTRACISIVKHGGPDGKPGFVVREQRWTNLIQSFLCFVAMFLTPICKMIPRSVLWGFFIYMALESLPGSEFWDRLQLFFTDKKSLPNLVRGQHNLYLDMVPLDVVLRFTAMQALGVGICYGITWAGAIGVIFPVFIMLLVPFRKTMMKHWFEPQHLAVLDPLEDDDEVEVPSVPASGTVGDIASQQPEDVTSKFAVLKKFFTGSEMYPSGHGRVAQQTPDVGAILKAKLEGGSISQEAYGNMLAVMAKVKASNHNTKM